MKVKKDLNNSQNNEEESLLGASIEMETLMKGVLDKINKSNNVSFN